MKYLVQINDYQCTLLKVAVVRLVHSDPEGLRTVAGETASNAKEEADLLVQMLEALPESERESPGTVHDLCTEM